MTNITITGPDKITEVVTDQYLRSDEGGIRRLQELINLFDAVVPLVSFLFKRLETTPFLKYRLKMVAEDGREWVQIVTFDNMLDPKSTFSTGNDTWRLTELEPRRVIQKFLFDIVPIWSPEELKVTWL